jgi:hypothetical protein
MKVKKVKFQSVLMLLALFLVHTGFAQKGRSHFPKHRGFSEALKQELNLTTEQQAEIQELQADLKEKIAAVKADESMERQEKKEKIKNLIAANQEFTLAVLTEEQLNLLKEKRQEKKEKIQARKADREALREELEAYRTEHILPTLLAQRKKLEADISEADKETLASLRIVFEEKKAARKAQFEEQKRKEEGKEQRRRKGKKKQLMREKDENHQTLKALVEKYESEINASYQEIAPLTEKWKADHQAIIAAFKAEHKIEDGAHPKRKGHKGKRKGMKGHQGKKAHFGRFMRKGAFLLLDPNKEIAAVSEAMTRTRIYPNPSSNINTLEYTVKEAGFIKIEIHDAQGRLVRTLLNDNKTPGTYQINTNLSDLKNPVYFYVITDKQGVSTKKLLLNNK